MNAYLDYGSFISAFLLAIACKNAKLADIIRSEEFNGFLWESAVTVACNSLLCFPLFNFPCKAQ